MWSLDASIIFDQPFRSNVTTRREGNDASPFPDGALHVEVAVTFKKVTGDPQFSTGKSSGD